LSKEEGNGRKEREKGKTGDRTRGEEREAKQGMILTTAKNQQKHSDELFVRNSCIWALQMCILATRDPQLVLRVGCCAQLLHKKLVLRLPHQLPSLQFFVFG
jgi:hypothetical protein